MVSHRSVIGKTGYNGLSRATWVRSYKLENLVFQSLISCFFLRTFSFSAWWHDVKITVNPYQRNLGGPIKKVGESIKCDVLCGLPIRSG